MRLLQLCIDTHFDSAYQSSCLGSISGAFGETKRRLDQSSILVTICDKQQRLDDNIDQQRIER